MNSERKAPGPGRGSERAGGGQAEGTAPSAGRLEVPVREDVRTGPSAMDPSAMDLGAMDPGATDPGAMDPGATDPGAMGRRAALKLMAASSLLATGMAGCRRKPHRKIVSMVSPPEYQKPGLPVHYATTWTMGQVPYGLMIKAVDGRPIKIEGLPDHPLNQGTATAEMQASILSLYDPDRLQQPHQDGQPGTWAQVDEQLVARLREARRVVLVTRSTLGPAERALAGQFLAACGGGVHCVHEALHDGPRREAWQVAFGEPGELRARLDQARVILSLDADFLGVDGPVLEATRQFAAGRRLAGTDRPARELSRLYVLESAMTVTGSNADHRVPLKPSQIARLVPALRAAVGGDQGPLVTLAADHALSLTLLQALVKDLVAQKGRAVVLAGAYLPAAVHAEVTLLNADLDALGSTLQWAAGSGPAPVNSREEILAQVTADGGAEVVILLDVNLALDWPAESFAQLRQAAGCLVGLGQYADETLSACTYALPISHNLESWNDASPLPGVTSLCQPVMAPLFDTREGAASLLAWARALRPDEAGLAECEDWHAYVQRRWLAEVLPGLQPPLAAQPQLAWDEALRRGVVGVPETGSGSTLNREQAAQLAATRVEVEEGIELLIRPHHAIWDGRFAANAWLQELPDPVSKLVWENAAAVGPATAAQLGLVENDRLTVGTGDDATVTLPVLVQPGLAAGVVVVTLGHGRTRGASAADGLGVNVAGLMGRCGRPVTSWWSTGVTASRSGAGPANRAAQLVRTQRTFSMMDRPIVLQGTAAEYDHDPEFVKHRRHVPPLDQLDPAYDYTPGPKWVMAIDQSACTGCNACVIACQAENNIQVVGKDECGHGREMHWIRIDRYEDGPSDNPVIAQQPMLCQQCDNAPCESVCPVNATAHSDDGLNQQVYNRCVGTRYCANNCPYKVRRFNFFNYMGRNVTENVQELVFNPQVTVRSRGVMEKCTFCVQRINAAKFAAANAGQPVPDGAVRTACQQTCPAGAIFFGNLNDPHSQIANMHGDSLAYFVLQELNVRPNVAYLARVTNPHPDVAGPPEEKHS